MKRRPSLAPCLPEPFSPGLLLSSVLCHPPALLWMKDRFIKETMRPKKTDFPEMHSCGGIFGKCWELILNKLCNKRAIINDIHIAKPNFVLTRQSLLIENLKYLSCFTKTYKRIKILQLWNWSYLLDGI